MAIVSDMARLRQPIVGLIVANVAVTALYMVLNLACGGAGVEWLTLRPGWSALLWRPWTPLSYMFVQWSFLHLLFNMLWLWCFGRIFIAVGREGHLVWLYLAGGLAGAVAALTAMSVPGIGGGPLAGASASVIAIGVATAFMAPDFGISLFLIGRVALRWVVVAVVVLICLDASAGAGGVAAHAGGIAAGAAYGMWRRGVFARLTGRRRDVHVSDSTDTDHEALDTLLDKVRRSGYASLSASERKRLFDISSRLK